jgi:RPA family protein
MGRAEFEEWSSRIIAGACIPDATKASQQFALADMIMHLGPTESHKPDAHFIHTLRKVCVNQVASVMRKELYDSEKERLAKEEELRIANLTPEQRQAEEMAKATQERLQAQKLAAQQKRQLGVVENK